MQVTYSLLLASAVFVQYAAALDNGCSGYQITASSINGNGDVTADLGWAGPPCNVYGYDLGSLKLLVEYQTGMPPLNLVS